MKYDDASWYLEGDTPKYPAETPEIHASVMPGMYLAWAIQNDLTDTIHTGEAVTKLNNREITPAEYLEICDGMLTDEDFTETGNEFTNEYYQGENGDGQYAYDYFETFGVDNDSMFTVPNTWEAYDMIAKVLDERLVEWNSGR
jgi:hypothetical protein